MGCNDQAADAAARGDYAAALRLAREHRGWTQAELGRRVGYDRSVISRYESGVAAPRDLCTVTRLADALHVSPSVLGAARFRTTHGEDEMRRRQVLATAVLALAGVPLGSPPPDLPRRISVAHALDVQRETDILRAAIYRHGAGRQVRERIGQLLTHVTDLTRLAPDGRTRLQLLGAMGDLGGLAAYAHRDLGDRLEANDYYLLAIQAAKAADDSALVGHLVVRMAGHHIELDEPDIVLDYLKAARATTTFGPGELSNQCAIAAWAYAQQNNPQGVHRAVGLAEEHFAKCPSQPGQRWQIRHTAEAELYSLTGAAFSELARHDARYGPEAIQRLGRARALREEPFARNDTLDAISLAESYLALHDVHEAVKAGAEALAQARRSSSRRVRTRLSAMAGQLATYERRSDAAHLIHEVDVLTDRAYRAP
jgi:transcriptional regulator with XRE-family HTH domain